MHYVVDAANRIVDLDDDWDQAAAASQGGPGSLRQQLIGRQLESCLLGDATKMFVRAALDAARVLGQTRVLPYRCDNAEQHRRFEMVVSPLPDGQVKVTHRLVLATPLTARRAPLRPATAPGGWRCSQCLRVRLIGAADWTDLALLPQDLLAQDICPDCAGRLFEAEQFGARARHANAQTGTARGPA